MDCDMPFGPRERAFFEQARVGRLATADTSANPHVVAICYACVDDAIITPIDAKPKSVDALDLQRVKHINANPQVALLVDHYSEAWDELGWVRVDGSARVIDPGDDVHAAGVSALRGKYEQYVDHPLSERPAIVIDPHTVRSWGAIDRESR